MVLFSTDLDEYKKRLEKHDCKVQGGIAKFIAWLSSDSTKNQSQQRKHTRSYTKRQSH